MARKFFSKLSEENIKLVHAQVNECIAPVSNGTVLVWGGEGDGRGLLKNRAGAFSRAHLLHPPFSWLH